MSFPTGRTLSGNTFIGWQPVASRLLGTASGVLSPADHSAAATALTDAAETALFAVPCRVLHVTGTGNIIVTLWDDDTSVAANKVTVAVTAGDKLAAFVIRKIWATGTTATFNALG